MHGGMMEIFGGFMVMMGILGFFLAVVWLVLPFVVFAIKGKVDRTLELLENMERRLARVEERLSVVSSARQEPPAAEPHTPPCESPPPSAGE